MKKRTFSAILILILTIIVGFANNAVYNQPVPMFQNWSLLAGLMMDMLIISTPIMGALPIFAGDHINIIILFFLTDGLNL